ncbi:chemotaxis protein CheW [Duganella sp.]|uniref:chemotaxis protein CheW n=1 Tax=Duganella sp. TaxID=1904440 RepID=UPI0031E2ED5F
MADSTDNGVAPHVVVRIGAARIGIPADNVLRALSAPEQFAPLPRRHGALLGVLAVDGQPVPVIDLSCWVALAGASGGELHLRRVVLLRAGERMAALCVDTLDPMTALPASAVLRLCHDDDPEQLFHSAAVLPDSGETLALLNVGNLFDLSHSWCHGAGVPVGVEEALPEGPAAAPTQTWALLQAFGEHLAVRAEHVAEVLPMPLQERFLGGSGVTLCRWRDGHLAVLPLARLLGRETADAPLLAVLRLGEQSLGLPIHQVCELRQLPESPQGVRTEAAGRLPCLSVTEDDGTTLRLVDAPALFAMHPEAALNVEIRQAAQGGVRRNEETYVVLDAGGKLALPIGAFEEVLHVAPEQCVAAPSGGSATLHWRGATIAVHDVRKSSPQRGNVPLVVLRTETAPVALAVDGIVSMITPGSAQLNRLRRGGEMVDLLILDEESGSSTYRVADASALLKLNADRSAARLSPQ